MTGLASVQTSADYEPIPLPMVILAIIAVTLLVAVYAIPAWRKAQQKFRDAPWPSHWDDELDEFLRDEGRR